MSKTIIHVGLHKTATTFLQLNVWPQISGYTYLSRPYTQHNHSFNQLQYADDSLYDKNLVIRELNRIAANRLLISDESFSGKPLYFSYLNRSIIAKRLKDLFPKAEIILFLRDQKDIILSHYSGYTLMPYGIKQIKDLFYRPGPDYTYDDYLDKPHRYQMSSLYYNTNDYFIHLDCFLYTNLVSLYIDLFDKCHVFLYEDFEKDFGESIARLEEIVGEHIGVKSMKRENVSLSPTQIEKRRKANCVPPISNKYLRKLVQVAIRIASNAQDKDLKIIAHEIAGGYYSQDNQALKSMLPSIGWDKHPDKYT